MKGKIESLTAEMTFIIGRIGNKIHYISSTRLKKNDITQEPISEGIKKRKSKLRQSKYMGHEFFSFFQLIKTVTDTQKQK